MFAACSLIFSDDSLIFSVFVIAIAQCKRTLTRIKSMIFVVCCALLSSGGSRISQRGVCLPLGGAPTYYLPNFSGKLHEIENEKKMAERGVRASLASPLDPSLLSNIYFSEGHRYRHIHTDNLFYRRSMFHKPLANSRNRMACVIN